jgi:sulfite reductase (NADPH) hemoprotein beta-component
VLSSAQLRALAVVAREHSDGVAHVTTRQNIQFYGLPLPQVEGVMRLLAEVGVTTREACGNSVRSVTACPLAGVSPNEFFDVTPYADALTRYLLRGPRSATLPRKFKIAMEGCRSGCGVAPINDLAFIARIDASGRRGFLVLAGGGTATLVRSGQVLAEFLPAAEILELAEAVLRVYHREGERNNKHKARLKWLIKQIGFAEFAKRVAAERATLTADDLHAATLPFAADDPPLLPLPAPAAPAPELPLLQTAPGYQEWRSSNVRPQKQTGYVTAQVTLALGDLRPPQLDGLAALSEEFGDGQVRTTTDQNIVLRFVQSGRLPALYQRLTALGLGSDGAGWLGDVTSCPGADTCAIAITTSRGVARSIAESLTARRQLPAGDPAALRDGDDLDGAHIRVSGCPNGCGQHHVAAIGLQGGLRKIGDRALPVYHLSIGGSIEESAIANGVQSAPALPAARFGRLIGKLPVRRGAAAVNRLLGLWQRERQDGEPLRLFLARVPLETVRSELADLLHITEQTATAEDYIDLGQSAPFVVSDAEGECAA